MRPPSTARRAIFDYAISALLLIVPLLFFLSNFKDPGRLNFLDRAILTISSPLQSLAGWVIGGVGGAWDGYVALIDIEEENDELRTENRELRKELLLSRQRLVDTHSLERLVDLRQRIPAHTVGGRVVATGMDPHFRVKRLVIEGKDKQVKPGMAVLTPEGLVGRVQRAYKGYAEVLLAVDAQSAIDVIVPRTGSRGIMRGLGSSSGYRGELDYVLRSEKIEVGDLVVTSGLGGSFPRLIPVGRVTKIEKLEYGLFQRVELEPAVDFSRLSDVLIVIAPAPVSTGDVERKAPGPAFGVAPPR